MVSKPCEQKHALKDCNERLTNIINIQVSKPCEQKHALKALDCNGSKVTLSLKAMRTKTCVERFRSDVNKRLEDVSKPCEQKHALKEYRECLICESDSSHGFDTETRVF